MSKDRAKNRAAREHEAALRTAAKAGAKEHQERVVSMRLDAERSGPREAITPKTHHKTPAKGPRKAVPRTASKAAPAGRKTTTAAKSTAKPSSARAQNGKRRGHKTVGRADGPLARRRRLRVRLLLVVLLAVNVAVGIIWRDWEVTLAALIVTAITAPLLAAVLLRRKR